MEVSLQIIYLSTESIYLNWFKSYYRPQRSWAKVIFSQVCVCPQGWGEGCLPQCMLGYPLPRADPPGGDTPRPGTLLAADTPHPPPHPREAHCNIQLMSSQYASYWKAFLFHFSDFMPPTTYPSPHYYMLISVVPYYRTPQEIWTMTSSLCVCLSVGVKSLKLE